MTCQSLAEGEQIASSITCFEKGAILPLHKHRREQVGYVMKGKIKMTSEGKAVILEKGDSYALKGGVEHEFEGIEELKLLYGFRQLTFNLRKYLAS